MIYFFSIKKPEIYNFADDNTLFCDDKNLDLVFLNLDSDLSNVMDWFKINFLKVGLSPSKKNCVTCLIESPLKMMKNAFHFNLKALFVLKIFKFLPQLFGHVGKTV